AAPVVHEATWPPQPRCEAERLMPLLPESVVAGPMDSLRGVKSATVRAAESPQSAAPSDNPRVTAPVNFSALIRRYSAPTRGCERRQLKKAALLLPFAV